MPRQSPEELKQLMRQVADLFERADVARIPALFSPAYVDHQRPTWMVSEGLDEIRDVILLSSRNLPGLSITVLHEVAEGDTVVGRWRWVSTDGATSRERETIEMLRVDGGRVVEHWGARYSPQ